MLLSDSWKSSDNEPGRVGYFCILLEGSLMKSLALFQLHIRIDLGYAVDAAAADTYIKLLVSQG